MEQENRELKEELARLTALMESFIAAQNQPAPTLTTLQQRTAISEFVSPPVSVNPTSQLAQAMPTGFSWGGPPNCMPEAYAPIISSMQTSRPIMSTPPPMVHVMPRVDETIYHSEPSQGPGVYEKIDEMKDQFQELRKELKTLRGKDLFGKSVVELCLIPNMKIPVKFKVP